MLMKINIMMMKVMLTTIMVMKIMIMSLMVIVIVLIIVIQGSYWQVCVKFKDFSRAFERLSYCFQGL